MGQKVNPSSFRLDVPHRGHSSLRFRSQERYDLLGQERHSLTSRINPSSSPDFKGWDHSIRGIQRRHLALGEYLGFLGQLEAEINELAISCSRLLNRTSSVRSKSSSGSHRERCFQWIPLDGLPRTGKDELKLRLEIQQREWKAEEAWIHHGLSLRGMGKLHMTVSSVNLLEKALTSDHWSHELGQMMSLAGLEKTEEEIKRMKSQTSMVVSSKGINDDKNASLGTSYSLKPTLLKSFMLSGVFPVSQLRANILCFMVEQEDSQTQALNEFHQLRLITSASKEYGILRYEIDLESGKESNNYGMKAKGGYRGCRVLVKGRLDGSRRTRTETIQMGVVPLSTRSSPRDWSHRSATTKYGSMGIEVIYSY